MAPYQHSPLNKIVKEIRVLTLYPGDFSAELQVSIYEVALLPDTLPIYEALSYI